MPAAGSAPTSQTVWITSSAAYSVTVTDSIGCTRATNPVLVDVLLHQGLALETLAARIYPNPASEDLLTLEIDPTRLPLYPSCEIYNALGQLIIEEQQIQQEKTTLPIAGLSSSSYFVHVKYGDEREMLQLVRTK